MASPRPVSATPPTRPRPPRPPMHSPRAARRDPRRILPPPRHTPRPDTRQLPATRPLSHPTLPRLRTRPRSLVATPNMRCEVPSVLAYPGLISLRGFTRELSIATHTKKKNRQIYSQYCSRQSTRARDTRLPPSPCPAPTRLPLAPGAGLGTPRWPSRRSLLARFWAGAGRSSPSCNSTVGPAFRYGFVFLFFFVCM